MLESLVKEFNGKMIESKWEILIEATIEEINEELKQYNVVVDPKQEEGYAKVENKVFTWNIITEGTSKTFYCDLMDSVEFEEAYEEIKEFEDDDAEE